MVNFRFFEWFCYLKRINWCRQYRTNHTTKKRSKNRAHKISFPPFFFCCCTQTFAIVVAVAILHSLWYMVMLLFRKSFRCNHTIFFFSLLCSFRSCSHIFRNLSSHNSRFSVIFLFIIRLSLIRLKIHLIHLSN